MFTGSAAFAKDLVDARRKEVETIGRDRIHECVAAAGEDDDAVIRIFADLVEQVSELLACSC
jgi:hypothetical protein